MYIQLPLPMSVFSG